MRDRRSEPDPALVDGHTPVQVVVPVADLLARPGGARDRQVIFGETLRLFSVVDGMAYVIADKDGYVGFVPQVALGPVQVATHRVAALASHIYAEANMKSPDLMRLSLGARITAKGETPKFIETDAGFVPKVHLAVAESVEASPVDVARRFVGVPYLWGGNSSLGLDCSALVQTALLACGIACPGDSDQQEKALGSKLPIGTAYQAGDILFWKGHVGLMADTETLLHANAHHMAVAYESVTDAIARIERQGDGPVTGHVRLNA